jgi:ribosomal protein S18 acetylase RimI-like enzyme
VLGAWVQGVLLGSVTLILDVPENQPHRGEIAKLVTRGSARGQGIGTALMQTAEAQAVAHGRTLLVLDTAEDGGAAPFYEARGYTCAGAIPDYALTPSGKLTATLLYWKRLRA